MALDAIILDVDGTLIDTNSLHARAWRQAFEEKDFDIPADRILPEIGKGGDLLVPSILGAGAEKELGEQLREAAKRHVLQLIEQNEIRVFDGAEKLLRELKERGLKLAVATSAAQEEFEALTKKSGLDLRALTDVITNADDTENSKPAPDIVLVAAQKLGVSPAQCAMLGDTPYDAQACRHAGVVCIGVLEGSVHSADTLMEAGARLIYESVQELLDDLDEALCASSPGATQWTRQFQEELMRAALATARDGMKNGEVPIGAVLARSDGTIIARGYNEVNGQQLKTAHAEIVTFNHSAGQVPTDAKDLVLVSTLEPCVMCLGAAMEAAVDTVLYGLKAPADSGTGRVQAPCSPESTMPRIVGDILAEESRALFEEWLEENGDTEQAPFVHQLLELTGE